MPAAAYPDAPRQWNHSRSERPWQAARSSTRTNFYATRELFTVGNKPPGTTKRAPMYATWRARMASRAALSCVASCLSAVQLEPGGEVRRQDNPVCFVIQGGVAGF